MLNDPHEIAAMFEGTRLAGCPIKAEPSGVLRMSGIQGDLLSAWQSARAALSTTHRWPVLVAVDLVSDPDTEGPADVAAFDAKARSIDPWPHGGCWEDVSVDPAEFDLHLPNFFDEKLRLQARADLPSPSYWSIDRWVYRKVLDDPELFAQANEGADYLVGTDYWFCPSAVEILLLPTPQPHLAAGWVGLYGLDQDILGALLLHWHQQWGAELVASWGTMLQLVVSRRPALGEEAWTLARQHKAFASHQDADHWELALALSRSDTWFLHSRP